MSLVGIEFTEEKEEPENGVRKLSKENSGVAVNILPILRYLDIEKPENKKVLKTSRENNLLVIDLKDLGESEEE